MKHQLITFPSGWVIRRLVAATAVWLLLQCVLVSPEPPSGPYQPPLCVCSWLDLSCGSRWFRFDICAYMLANWCFTNCKQWILCKIWDWLPLGLRGCRGGPPCKPPLFPRLSLWTHLFAGDYLGTHNETLNPVISAERDEQSAREQEGEKNS